VARITSEFGYVLLNPLEDLSLVTKSVVGRNFIAVCEEAIEADSVVEVDEDHIMLCRFDHGRSVDMRLGVCVEGTSLEVNPYRQSRGGRSIGWSCDIKVETVF
jgi:hypothetical protein